MLTSGSQPSSLRVDVTDGQARLAIVRLLPNYFVQIDQGLFGIPGPKERSAEPEVIAAGLSVVAAGERERELLAAGRAQEFQVFHEARFGRQAGIDFVRQ